MKRRHLIRWSTLLLLLLAACAERIEPTRPGETTETSTGTLFQAARPAADWVQFAPGVEFRMMPVYPTQEPAFEMQVVRLDPTRVHFRVHYRPDDPLPFARWLTALENPLAFVNGGFFDPDNRAIGLLVADGQAAGYSLTGYGGMFQVDSLDNVRVRSLVQEPYQGEVLQQAVQAFPMLVEYGGMAARTGEGFEATSRRTVVAQDRQGRILLMTTGLPGVINFYDLQAWLLGNGLEINVALNLDGGQSTAMYVARPGGLPVLVPALNPLPVILAVYPN